MESTSLIMFLVIGAVAGWLAGLLMKGRGFGLIGNIIVGIIGAFIGGFLAGMLVADSEYRHQLETDIAPFKGLLLGLFFITVGAAIRFDLLFDSFGAVVAMTKEYFSREHKPYR